MPAPIHQLSVGSAFDGLTQTEKFYAHHLARAAWHGTRIILRQVSNESIPIFDFILEICRSQPDGCKALAKQFASDAQELDAFLVYASSFLSNIGNFSDSTRDMLTLVRGRCDQKIIPKVSPEFFQKLAAVSVRATELYKVIEHALFSKPPFSLGYPSDTTTSAYYPGPARITKDEISMISRVMQEHQIYPENTRLRKTDTSGQRVYDILQASVETDAEPIILTTDITGDVIRLIRGDHAEELSKICACLTEAAKFAASPRQRLILNQYCENFRSGDLHIYRESQRQWIADRAPRVENIFGFVEPYRDPQGIRAEWEALVAFPNAEETELLTKLVKQSKTFIRRLPWAKDATDNDGQGPFEKEDFDPPDFASIHTLAYCSSIIFGGINLPNYNDIRQECGFRNVIIANRMTAESRSKQLCHFVDDAEAESFQKHRYHALYMWVVIHELLGHGTGKMMMEEPRGKYNFDAEGPPVDLLTGKPITSWYKPGRTWTGQFEDLATTVDECRCELVGAYLMDDVELLALFGFGEDTAIQADDLTYYFYLLLGYSGLRALSSFNLGSMRWGQAHSRAHFAMLKCLLLEGQGFMRIDHDPSQHRLTVKVDRQKIAHVGKPVLGAMLLKLHMYRATAKSEECRTYYENLSSVSGEYLEWRKTVIATAQPGYDYVHANTTIHGDHVVLREYDATAECILQSWVDRKV